MPTTKTTRRRPATSSTPPREGTAVRAREALAELERLASPAVRDGLARYGIPSEHALGVAMKDIQGLARRLGQDHALATALWKTGVYEARMLCAYVGEVDRVTPAEMKRWSGDFDNWALCDTLCFALWDRSPHAWAMADTWAGHRDEFVKRAAFALFASLAVHDKAREDAPFLDALVLIERESTDARNFVKKGVNWALRAIGGRRSPALRKAARALATRLAGSGDATARWNGRDALRAFAKADAKPPKAEPKTTARKKAAEKTPKRAGR
ncbi:DNA alkylation repair protein [Myxococcus sp. 1LA]